MTTIQVTIDLPQETYKRAKRFAHLLNRDLSVVLAETVVSSLPSLSDEADALPSVSKMSDAMVLELANSTMAEEQDKRLSELLEKQRENLITASEKQELDELMQIYNEGWLRKTAGIVEAVQRGLMERLDS